MLERTVKQDEGIHTSLCLLDKSELIIPTADIDLIKGVIEALRPFEAVITEMSSDSYVSISKIIPLSRALQRLTRVHGVLASEVLSEKLISAMRRWFF